MSKCLLKWIGVFYLVVFVCVTPATGAVSSVTRPRRRTTYKNILVSINIVDRNGLSETICSKEKLKKYLSVNFLDPQPYQKVLRIYKNQSGENAYLLTGYHPNGQIKQYLEGLNNRALGTYKEWFSNGQLKIHAKVVGGVADLNPAAEAGWLFDGTTEAFDEDGNCIAQIPYEKGSLEGIAVYFHPNGNVWKEVPYQKNSIHGTFNIYLSDNRLLQETQFRNGKKHGLSLRYHSPDILAHKENYIDDRLIHGSYFQQDGTLLSEIIEGNGTKINFGKTGVASEEEYRSGNQHGQVSIFDNSGCRITRMFRIENNLKTGEEVFYHSDSSQPQLLITREHGIIQGPIKTWYENGNLESCRQMSCNKKNGLATVYYSNGQIMMVEEYENDLLIKGEYYKPGDKQCCSKVEKGNGIATLFTKNGAVNQKIIYQDGKPLLD
ncbi:MAG: hypothetical protein RR599_02275 [Victivallaceae bacterium]